MGVPLTVSVRAGMPLTRLLLTVLVSLNSGCAAVVVAGGATAAVVAQDRRTLSTQLDDETIERKAAAILRNESQSSDQSRVSVSGYNGVVLLTGTAAHAGWRDRSLAGIRGITGVKRVIDEVRVGAPATEDAQRQNGWLGARARARLLNTRDLDSGYIRVVADGGSVYLFGLVTQAQGELATDAVRLTDGAQRVVKLFEYVE